MPTKKQRKTMLLAIALLAITLLIINQTSQMLLQITLISDGFESGDFSAWTGTYSSGVGAVISCSNDVAHHGSYSAKVVLSNTIDYAMAEKIFAPQTTIFGRFYFRVTALPGEVLNDLIKLFYLEGAGVDILELALIRREANSLTIRLYEFYPTGLYKFTSALDIVVDTWYCLEVKFVKDASAGEYRLWFNGVEVITHTGLDTSASPTPDKIDCPFNKQGGTLTNPMVYTDCVVVADAYIGP